MYADYGPTHSPNQKFIPAQAAGCARSPLARCMKMRLQARVPDI
ncbi:hypothetical protein B932_1121 [Gluconobacter oxydans H24]|nr:hypothetical protein B932_1121 [Gluconobacter oxydans H24]